MFGTWHLVLLGLAFGLFAILTVIAVVFRRHKKFTKVYITVIFFLGFALHFVRLVFPHSVNADLAFPMSLKTAMPITFCAVNAIVFPFIFLCDNKYLKDYMFYIGLYSGIAGTVFATTLIGYGTIEFDVFRSFFMHGVIFYAPIMMVLCGHHKLSWRRIWIVPVGFFVTIGITIVSSVIIATFYNNLSNLPNECNETMAFGYKYDSLTVKNILNALCPPFFRTAPADIPSLGILKGDEFYWPVIWLVCPIVILIVPTSFFICLIFDFKNFRRDMLFVYYTLFGKFEKRQLLVETTKLSRLKNK
jgi:hypothetical protein